MQKKSRWITAIGLAAVLAVSGTFANAQIIGSGMTGEDDYICGSDFTAPTGAVSFRTFIRNLNQYFNEDLSRKWGYDAQKYEVIPEPLVAFQLNANFSIQLGSLYYRMTGLIPINIRALECYDLIVKLPDGTQRPLAFIAAELNYGDGDDFTKPENAAQNIEFLFSKFLAAFAEGKEVLIIARLNVYSLLSRGDRIQQGIFNFGVVDYHIYDKK